MSEAMRARAVKLPAELDDWVAAQAAHDGARSRSSVIRAVLEQARAATDEARERHVAQFAAVLAGRPLPRQAGERDE